MYGFELILAAVSAELRWAHLRLFTPSEQFALGSNARLGTLFCETGLGESLVSFITYKLRLTSPDLDRSFEVLILPLFSLINIKTW